MDNKSILYLGRFFPWPANTGGKKVSLGTIKILSKNYHLHYIGFKDRYITDESLNYLQKDLGDVSFQPLRLFKLKRYPKLFIPLFNIKGLSYYFFRDIYKEIEDLTLFLLHKNRYSALFIDEIFGARILLNKEIFDCIKNKNIKILVQAHNIEHKLIERYLKNKNMLSMVLKSELKLARKWEEYFWKLSDAVIFISKDDYNLACEISEGNFHWFFPVNLINNKDKQRNVNLSKQTNTILHIGTGHWPPNVEGIIFFLKQVFPLIKQAIPNAKFIHIGKGTPKSLRKYHNNKDIYIYDYVENLTPYYETANVFVVPLLSGSGIKIKIIDAIQRGLPVVTTPVGAEGIPIKDGIIVTKSKEEMSEAIIKLITDKDFRISVGNAAFANARSLTKKFKEEKLLNIIKDAIHE